MNEKMEREKRKNNVVILGINEADDSEANPQERIRFHKNNILQFHVGVNDALKSNVDEIEKVIRAQDPCV